MRLPFRLAAVLSLILSAEAMHADQYQVFTLGNDQGHSLVGMDDAGNVYLNGSGFDLLHFSYGVYVGRVDDSLPVARDIGTDCTLSLPAGLQLFRSAKCNNGRDVFAAFVIGSPVMRPNVYVGLDPAFELLQYAGGDLYLNSVGDIVIDDEFNDTLYEAINLSPATAPEPSSIALLGTALLGLGGALRRRLS